MANNHQWKKRILRFGPIIGLLAMVFAVCCIVAAWKILNFVDGQLVNEYKLPSYLAATSALIAMMIRFAFGGGLAVHWWRKSLDVRSVSNIHRRWKVGQGILHVISNPREFGLVSIAVIARTSLIIVSPLLQLTIDYNFYPDVGLTIYLREQMPAGWAGSYDRKSGAISSSDTLNGAHHGFAQRKRYDLSVLGCDGRCNTSINAPGVTLYSCASSKKKVDMDHPKGWPESNDGYTLFDADFSTRSYDQPQWFGTGFDVPEHLPGPDPNQESIIFWTTSVNTTNGTGNATFEQCWLKTVVMNYTIDVTSDGDITHFEAVRINQTVDNAPASDDDRKHSAANSNLETVIQSMHLYLRSATFFQFEADGSTTTSEGDQGSLGTACILADRTIYDFATCDPKPFVSDMLNEIYLRAAILIDKPTTVDNPDILRRQQEATEQHVWGYRFDADATVYSIVYFWYYIAATLQLIAIALTGFLYWGWWELGRRVSLSPIEVAKAFDAPLFQNTNSNSSANDIMDDIGHMRIRYGAAKSLPGFVSPTSDKQSSVSPGTAETCDRLTFGPPDKTVRPYGGQQFAK